jgi:hypothetical protein
VRVEKRTTDRKIVDKREREISFELTLEALLSFILPGGRKGLMTSCRLS